MDFVFQFMDSETGTTDALLARSGESILAWLSVWFVGEFDNTTFDDVILSFVEFCFEEVVLVFAAGSSDNWLSSVLGDETAFIFVFDL